MCAGRRLCRPCRPQQVADRPVHRHRIARGLDRAELEAPGGIGDEAAAQVHVGLRRILVLVEAFGARVPDVDLGAFDRPPFAVDHLGAHEHRIAGRRRAHDRVAARRRRRAAAPERAEQVRRAAGLVVHQADERREAERAGAEHHLVVRRRRHLPGAGDRRDEAEQLGLAELHLARERVQVAHRGEQQLALARVGRAPGLGEHGGGDVVCARGDHAAVSSMG
jgi:hypothetical protein